jgi:ferritin
MKKWLQKSIESELYASNFYKHTANQLQRLGYFGGQKYYLKESADELIHYQGLVDFINDMGDVADIPKVDAVTDEIKSIGDTLDLAYELELDLYNQYKDFYEIAEDEDMAVAQFLLQYIEIQRKSVGEYGDLISRYNKCGKNEAAILEFDEYLSEK